MSSFIGCEQSVATIGGTIKKFFVSYILQMSSPFAFISKISKWFVDQANDKDCSVDIFEMIATQMN